MLKRSEAEEEKGKDDDDGDDGVIDQATFGLQPAVHYGFRHLFIYFEKLMLVLRLSLLCLYTRIYVLIFIFIYFFFYRFTVHSDICRVHSICRVNLSTKALLLI